MGADVVPTSARTRPGFEQATPGIATRPAGTLGALALRCSAAGATMKRLFRMRTRTLARPRAASAPRHGFVVSRGRMRRRALAAAAARAAAAAARPVAPVAQPAPAPPTSPRTTRSIALAFNRVAVHLNLPLYWTSDANNERQVIDPSESRGAPLLSDVGRREVGRRRRVHAGVRSGVRAHRRRQQRDAAPARATPEETQRRKLVIQDLDQARPTLVENDLSALSADDKDFVRHVLAASDLVDRALRRADRVGAARFARARRRRREPEPVPS